jgi:hypothetical protein
MFTTKKTTLLPQTQGKTSVNTNAFVNAGLKTSATTRSENGALKYSTTGSDFVDQFGKLGSYKAPRSFADISRDMSTLYAQNPTDAVKFALYMRTVSRQVQYFDGTKTETVQRGAGLKHEAIMRFTWLAVNHPNTFWQNIELIPLLGSWNDIFVMLQNDLVYNGWEGRLLDWNKFGQLLLAGLENPNTTNLVKKYLPQIKARSATKTVEAQADTMIGKWIASMLFPNMPDGYKQYRKMKTSGTAHEWQKLISTGKFLEIDFKTIHGRALSKLVSGKFLANKGLDKKYQSWIESQPIAKFTGYPHELFIRTNGLTPYQEMTINKQFDGLVETAKKNAETNTGLIVVRDTSGSMGSLADGTKQTCFDIAKALALFFSKMLPNGHFANSFIEFNNTAKMHQWKGFTPLEMWKNDKTGYVGSTDFQSVIKLFASIKQSGVTEDQFPTGILCISDSEFNPTSLKTTNVEAAKKTLLAAGFSKEYVDNFKIVLWNLQRTGYGGHKFETYGETKNVFYFSGYDASTIAFLTGVNGKTAAPSTDVELFQAAMDQEILNQVKVQ